uniref:J domain-containing protein n=1 Tax=Strongyloides stercoralis TaxID=6248 RepID=A0A0K0DSD4_STRER
MKNCFICNIPIYKFVFCYNIKTTPFLAQKDLYHVLGISKNCSHQDIKEAYFKKAKLVHPDLKDTSNINIEDGRNLNHQEFIDIKFAYDILRKPTTRRMYDNGVDPNFIVEGKFSKDVGRRNSFYRDFYNVNSSGGASHKNSTNSSSNLEDYLRSMIGSLKDKGLENVNREDEIARSYLRQFGEKGRMNNQEELNKYSQIFSKCLNATDGKKTEG